MRSVGGHAHAAAHHDAVHECDEGLGIARDHPVEPVFVAPEGAPEGVVPALAVLPQAEDVAARRERLVAATLDDDTGDVIGIPPRTEHREEFPHHGVGEGIEGAGPVQHEAAEASFAPCPHLRC